MNTPKPVVVVPSTSRRDTLLAIALGLVVLSFVVFGIVKMATPQESRNILVGVVIEKQFTPLREEQVSFSGRRLESTKQIDGEYVLKVRVEKENRSYDVPVEKHIYAAKQKGDTLEFLRPGSERR